MRDIYKPKIHDCVAFLIGILLIAKMPRYAIYSTSFWSAITFIIAIIVNSIVGLSIKNFNKQVKRNIKHMKRHKDVKYPKIKITEFQYDLHVNFKVFRLCINTIIMSVILIFYNIGTRSERFRNLTLAVFFNMFLIPLMLMIWYAFTYDCGYPTNISKTKRFSLKISHGIKNLFNAFYIKNEKKRPITGTIGVISLLIILSLLIVWGIYSTFPLFYKYFMY